MIGGHADLGTTLLDRGADPTRTPFNDDRQILVYAFDLHCSFDIISTLLDQFTDLARWNHPEHLAELACYGHPDWRIISMLIRKGLGVDQTAKWFGVALETAARTDNLEFAELLIRAGAGVYSRPLRSWGTEALSVAAFKGNIAMVKLLLNAGADVDSRSEKKQSPLSAASFKRTLTKGG